MFRTVLLAVCACAGLLTPPAATALAHDAEPTGGASVPNPPELEQALCVSGASACPRGESLRIKGEYLDSAKAVVFLGARGKADNRRVVPSKRSPHRVVARVPSNARSGPVQVLSQAAGASAAGPHVELAPAAKRPVAASGTEAGVFPVQGKYDFGTEVNRFGGGRGHKGQDVFATCGTPVVAALSGRVTLAKWQDRAGNYVVIKASDGTGQAYMHLQRPASVEKGQTVTAGEPIGLVGDTGRASGCHLHFELWTAPGWYEGGEPIDPLPALRQWARSPSAGRR